jgi:peptidyl-prolyl cis-trans isomerase NIMA-interacting 1
MKKIIFLITIVLFAGCNKDQPEQVLQQPTVHEVAAAHILITHSESETSFTPSGRTRTEAENLSLHLSVLCTLAGRDFGELAKQYSEDLSTKTTGGYLGIFQKGEMMLPFEVETFGMKIGDIKGGIETDLGFHVIKRLPVHRANASHILISWKGSRSAVAGIKRNRSQALLLAQELSSQLSKNPNLFCDVASKFSDDTGTRFDCGNVGQIVPGKLNNHVEDVLFRMSPGEISDIIETDFGYHIIRRDT